MHLESSPLTRDEKSPPEKRMKERGKRKENKPRFNEVNEVFCSKAAKKSCKSFPSVISGGIIVRGMMK